MDRLRGLLSEVDTSSIVIIAIDFELTWNTKEVTEVGLSILNMDNVSSTTLATPMSPLSYADNLAKHIKSYHLRTAQYYKWVNRFPPGSNPDGFDRRFGNSERIPAAKLVRRMKEIMWGSGQDKVYILMGCALENEHETLYHLAMDLSSIRHEIDIQVEDRRIRRRNKHGSLQKVCGKLGLPAQNLHNAGNDARYTLECLLRMVVMSSNQRGQYSWSPTSTIDWTDDMEMASTVNLSGLSGQGSSTSSPPEWLTLAKSSVTGEGMVHGLSNISSTVGKIIANEDRTIETIIATVTTNSTNATATTNMKTPETNTAVTKTIVTKTTDTKTTDTKTADIKTTKKKNRRQRHRAKKRAEAARLKGMIPSL